MIRNLYENFNVQLKLRSTLKNIPYETGVQQGDNVPPILFLFMMQVVMQTLKKSLLSKLEYRFFHNDKARTSFNLFSLLFVDNGAFVFQSKAEKS